MICANSDFAAEADEVSMLPPVDATTFEPDISDVVEVAAEEIIALPPTLSETFNFVIE